MAQFNHYELLLDIFLKGMVYGNTIDLEHFNFSSCSLFTISSPVVPKLGVNYPSGITCDSSWGYCSTKNTTLFYIMSDICEILRVIRRNRYLVLGNSSKKFGNHCSRLTYTPHHS